MLQLVVSDTNIFIDLEEGGILDEFFSLPYEIAVPDILYYEELAAAHSHLLHHGVKVHTLTSSTMLNAEKLMREYPKPSRNDCFALLLAKQESCPLLSGDADLRHAAECENIRCMGTIWIVEEMMKHSLLSYDKAKLAYESMRQHQRRLPWKEAFERLNALINRA